MMVGFVDDSTGTCNDFQPQTEAPLPDLLKRMEFDAQLWNNLLYCSGGKLELPKCSFHVLRFLFKPCGKPVPLIDTYDNMIQVKDIETQTLIPIPSKRSFDPHKTLGHYKAPTSRQTTELQTLIEKANKLALLISVSPVTRQGAMLSYQTVYIPTVQYTLPQSIFSRKRLEQAQAASIHRLIAKCGYNRHTARALIFAPLAYAGGGFLPWHLLQGEGQIKLFLKHWRTDSIVSNTLRITMQWAQWQSGHAISILEDTATPLPHLECRWIASIREFLHDINGKLIVDLPIVSRKERKNDVHIMTYAICSGSFDAQDLRIINYCRLYLHVTTISELFDVDGETIIPHLFRCQREPWFDPTTYVTLQDRPSDYQIRMKWQHLCRHWTQASGQIATSMTLGKWTTPGKALRRRRQTYSTKKYPNIIYHWNEGSYWEYVRSDRNSFVFAPKHPTTWTPQDNCSPVQALAHSNGTLQLFHESLSPRIPRALHFQIKSFSEYIEGLPTWEKILLQGVQMNYQPYEIHHMISNLSSRDSLLLVSDGSNKYTINTFGWVFGSNRRQIFATHAGEGDHCCTSHRAEGWGMLSGALFVYHLENYTQTPNARTDRQTPLTFWSDNNGLVTRITQRLQYTRNYPNATLAPDWDIVEQIYQTINKISLVSEITVQWVKGHQNDEDTDLPVEATYNIRADALATQEPSYHPGRCDSQLYLPAERCTLRIAEAEIHSHYTKSIRMAYTLPAFYDYLEQRMGWKTGRCQEIDWEVFNQASTNTTLGSVHLLKLVYEKLPTNSELHKANPSIPYTCRYCSERETVSHLMRCQNPISETFREQLSSALAQYMANREIPDEFHHTFLAFLESALTESPLCHMTRPTAYAQATLMAQMELGPTSFLKGFWSKRWRYLFIRTESRYSLEPPGNAIEFLSGLLRLVWQHQTKLWEQHLKEIHQSLPHSPHSLQDKLLQYKIKIRILHSKRDQCLHGHQDQYFYPDVEQFLRTATGTQLRQYLHHYEGAILASIKAAEAQPARTLFSFPGFFRSRSQTRAPNIPFPASLPSIRPLPKTRGAPLHKKHTRWKAVESHLRSIRQFFHPNPE